MSSLHTKPQLPQNQQQRDAVGSAGEGHQVKPAGVEETMSVDETAYNLR